jgi:hypothetical protein
MCSGGHNPTTMPKIGNNEIKNTSNHALESAICRIRANGATRRIVAAMRPQSIHAMNCEALDEQA